MVSIKSLETRMKMTREIREREQRKKQRNRESQPHQHAFIISCRSSTNMPTPLFRSVFLKASSGLTGGPSLCLHLHCFVEAKAPFCAHVGIASDAAE
jgi:hypothetical protein